MADFIIEVKLDASKTREGAREAKSVARSIQTDYENLIRIVEKYDQTIKNVGKFKPQINAANNAKTFSDAEKAALSATRQLDRYDNNHHPRIRGSQPTHNS